MSLNDILSEVSTDSPEAIVGIVARRAPRTMLVELIGDEYSIWEACSQGEAIGIARSQQANLLLVDCALHDGTAASMTRAVRTDDVLANLPVFAVSTRGDSDACLRALEAGADDFLTAPFDTVELKARMRRRLHRPEEVDLSDYRSADLAFVRRTLIEIDAHLGDADFNTQILAQGVGLSASTLKRHLRALALPGPGELIRLRRLERAAYLLRDGNCSVKETAYLVGYADPGYFSKAFREHFGVPPSQAFN